MQPSDQISDANVYLVLSYKASGAVYNGVLWPKMGVDKNSILFVSDCRSHSQPYIVHPVLWNDWHTWKHRNRQSWSDHYGQLKYSHFSSHHEQRLWFADIPKQAKCRRNNSKFPKKHNVERKSANTSQIVWSHRFTESFLLVMILVNQLRKRSVRNIFRYNVNTFFRMKMFKHFHNPRMPQML